METIKRLSLDKSFATNFWSLVVFIIPLIFPEIPFAGALYDMGLFAFSGGITNWIAIHMLFEKVPFLYGSGIITARFESFKRGIHGLIMNNFFSEDNFKNFVESADPGSLSTSLVRLVEKIDLDPLFDGLVATIQESRIGPMLAVFGGGSALEGLREPFTRQVRAKLESKVKEPDALKKLLGDEGGYGALRERIESMIRQRLDEMTPTMVKDIIQRMIREHLGWLVLWGGVFGGLIGLISFLIKAAPK